MKACTIIAQLPSRQLGNPYGLLNSLVFNETFTMIMIKDALFSEEVRRKEIGIDHSNAFVIEGRGVK